MLTLKCQEMLECVLSTVATDAMVLKNQAISIHSADWIIHCIGPVSYKGITFNGNFIGDQNNILKINDLVV